VVRAAAAHARARYLRGAWGRSNRLPHRKAAQVARKKLEPVDETTARTIGGLLRGLRRAAGYRAVRDAAARPDCPAAQQTIYAYERGGLVPSLKQFMELVEFYAFRARESLGEAERLALRYQAVAAMARALALPAYHVTEAFDLIARLQPEPARSRRRGDD
jgi:hypothetical protein